MESSNVPSVSGGETRLFNDYESMLVSSTCNVGLTCRIRAVGSALESQIRAAWEATVRQRRMLQIRLISGGMGSLGTRYHAADAIDDSTASTITFQTSSGLSTLQEIQRQGTQDLDVSNRSYVMAVTMDNGDSKEKVSNNEFQNVTFLMTLCHAVSDGPGTLYVMHDFLTNLQSQLEVQSTETMSPEKHHSLVDVQALLLGKEYGAAKAINEKCYQDVSQFSQRVMSGATQAVTGTTDASLAIDILPPESLQNLPRDRPLPHPSEIRVESFTLSKEETKQLRTTCREWNGTIQGALSVVSLMARLRLLSQTTNRTECVVQVPINCRNSANVALENCLCGSAGVLIRLIMDPVSRFSSLVTSASSQVQESIQQSQHVEWLRRLLNDPATMQPYSLMASSIGVASIREHYGETVSVEKGLFFGGSLSQPEPTPHRATMVHATTFVDRLQVSFNYSWPGVSAAAAQQSSHDIKQLLLAIANGRITHPSTLQDGYSLIEQG